MYMETALYVVFYSIYVKLQTDHVVLMMAPPTGLVVLDEHKRAEILCSFLYQASLTQSPFNFAFHFPQFLFYYFSKPKISSYFTVCLTVCV